MERYIVTLNGARITLTQGVPDIIDVAVASCRTPMFAGATRFPYSVAHHCVSAALLAREVSAEVALVTLLHELEIAVYGDIPGPVKLPEQRVVEKDVRARFFEANGLKLTDEIWSQVEFFDKVEQAASIRIVGLPEEAHAAIWDPTTPLLKDNAIRTVARVYLEYPPHEQLGRDSKLASMFTRTYRRLRHESLK